MNKNIKYFLLFLLPVFLIGLFIHEISHAFTAFILGAKNIKITFFQKDLGRVDWEGLNGFNEGLAEFFGAFTTFLMSVMLLLFILKIKNPYLRFFVFMLGILAPLDYITYAINGEFGLRHGIFFGSEFSIGEPQQALTLMGLPSLIAPISAIMMLGIYYPYYKIYKKIKWK